MISKKKLSTKIKVGVIQGLPKMLIQPDFIYYNFLAAYKVIIQIDNRIYWDNVLA
ncbi:MAG: hypothetical protein ACYC6P_06275 [Ignavibacteriaceae bacterium]